MNLKILITTLVIIAAIGIIIISLSKTIPSNSTQAGSYTIDQVATHNTANNCWMVINHKVYEVTHYLPNHPNSAIVDGCGKEATTLYESVRKHLGSQATQILNSLYLGNLVSNTNTMKFSN
jgi:cytochrome b involved in lipid metabolism